MVKLTIVLGDGNKRISVKGLALALQRALDLLRSVEADIGGAADGLEWEIAHISTNSPITIEFSAKGDTKHKRSIGGEVVKACVRGLVEIEKKTNPTAPRHFNVNTLIHAKELLQVADKEGMAVTLIPEKKKPIPLTDNSSKNIDELMSKARKYADVLSIEGKLDVISVHKRPSIIIWETLTNRRINCLIDKEELGKYAQLLGKRVAVTGRVHYVDHIPKTIHLESIRVLRDKRELPQPSTMKPINITDGLSSEEYVRRMRDG